MKNISEKKIKSEDQSFLKKFIFNKIGWSVLALFLVLFINFILNNYLGEYFNAFALKYSTSYLLSGIAFFASEILIGIFPAELFLMLYQSKDWNEYLIITLALGLISSICGFVSFLVGKYLNEAKFANLVLKQNKFKVIKGLFLKYGWVIIILAATTPLPFSLVCFISGYCNFPSYSFLKIVIPVRIIRFFISAVLIKYSINLL